MIEAALVALVWISLWAIFDILIVERIFRPLEAWGHIDRYHQATWWFLFPLTTLAVFRVSIPTLLVAILFLGGVEDTLYFWFQRKRVPAKLPWLRITPTRGRLLALNFVAVSLVVVIAVTTTT